MKKKSFYPILEEFKQKPFGYLRNLVDNQKESNDYDTLLEGIEKIWPFQPLIGLQFIDLILAVKKPVQMMQNLFQLKDENVYKTVVKTIPLCKK